MNPKKIMCFTKYYFSYISISIITRCAYSYQKYKYKHLCVSFNGTPEHDHSLSTRSSALCCSQDMGSLLDLSFATMDDNKQIQETRDLTSKIQTRVRKPQGDKEDEERS